MIKLAVALLLALACSVVWSNTSSAQQRGTLRLAPTGSAEWEGPLLAGRVIRLFVFADGSLVAETQDDVEASDDRGQTWRSVTLPPANPSADTYTPQQRLVGGDPRDARVLFARGADPLYKTNDGGATWQAVLTADRLDDLFRDSDWSKSLEPDPEHWRTQFHVIGLTVSPADSKTVYAEVAMRAAVGPYGLYASTDGGTTWTLRQKVTHTDMCTVQVMLLQAHPTDSQRMFRSVNCLAGWAFGASLTQSLDGGKTFAPFWQLPDWGDIPGTCGPSATTYGYPLALVGGAKPTSTGWYLAINRDVRFGGATVFHSADDGATWHEVLAFQGGGTPGYNCEPGDWSVRIKGVANDPADDALLYVARVAYRPGTFQPEDIVTSGIMMTADGGGSWTDLGRQDMGNLSHLALGPDGRTLYAANDEGVWRLDISAPLRIDTLDGPPK